MCVRMNFLRQRGYQGMQTFQQKYHGVSISSITVIRFPKIDVYSNKINIFSLTSELRLVCCRCIEELAELR